MSDEGVARYVIYFFQDYFSFLNSTKYGIRKNPAVTAIIFKIISPIKLVPAIIHSAKMSKIAVINAIIKNKIKIFFFDTLNFLPQW